MATKRALVTGAGKRLGRAMALSLADAGFDLALHYASSAVETEALAEEIRARGRQAETVQADLLIEGQTATVIPNATNALGGPLTLLVNNASIFEDDDLDTMTRESWDRHIESNLRSPVALTQAFAAQAPAPEVDTTNEPRAQALVVNMIDQRVRKLTPDFMSYTTAKMGLWAFTRTAAQALAPKVRVNAIGPGPTLKAAGQTEANFIRQRSVTPLNRGSNPEDICAALQYFLAAPAVTGQLICVDGGQHLNWQTPDAMGLE